MSQIKTLENTGLLTTQALQRFYILFVTVIDNDNQIEEYKLKQSFLVTFGLLFPYNLEFFQILETRVYI